MTQKELLYVEDGINHEQNVIEYCINFLEQIEDSDLYTFFENEIDYHNDVKNSLISLLKENTNE